MMKRSNIFGILFCTILLVVMGTASFPAGRYVVRSAEAGEQINRQFARDIPKMIAAIATDPTKGEFILSMERNRRDASNAMEKSFGKALCAFSIVFIALVIGSSLYQTARKPKL